MLRGGKGWLTTLILILLAALLHTTGALVSPPQLSRATTRCPSRQLPAHNLRLSGGVGAPSSGISDGSADYTSREEYEDKQEQPRIVRSLLSMLEILLETKITAVPKTTCTCVALNVVVYLAANLGLLGADPAGRFATQVRLSSASLCKHTKPLVTSLQPLTNLDIDIHLGKGGPSLTRRAKLQTMDSTISASQPCSYFR